MKPELTGSKSFQRLNPHLFGTTVDALGITADGRIVRAGEAVERESTLHNDIIAHCRSQGWLYIHSWMDKRATNQKGTPDFIIFMPAGKVLCVECKAKGGKQTSEQQAMEAYLRKLGHAYALVFNMEEFHAAIQRK